MQKLNFLNPSDQKTVRILDLLSLKSRARVNKVQLPETQPKFFYGWVMMPIAIVMMICTLPGQSAGVSVFNDAIRGSLGISKGQLSLAYAAGTIISSCFLPFAGYLMDRIGIRITMVIATVGLAVGCQLISHSEALPLLYVSFFLLRISGQGSLSMLSSNTMALWFDRRLGTLSGINSLVITIAMGTLPLVIKQFLVIPFGWRFSYSLMGWIVAAILLPIAFTLYRNRPEAIGQLPDGLKVGKSESEETPPSTVCEFDRFLDVTKQPTYYIFLLIFGAWAMVGTAMIFDAESFYKAKVPEGKILAEYAILCFFYGAAAMNLVGGFLADRLPLKFLTIGAMSQMLTSFLILIFCNGDWFFVSYLVFGLAQGLLTAVGGTVWVRFFGRTHIGKVKGFAMMAMVAGSSAGPLVSGFCFDKYKSYDFAWQIFTALLLIVLFAAFFVQRKVQTETEKLANLPRDAKSGT